MTEELEKYVDLIMSMSLDLKMGTIDTDLYLTDLYLTNLKLIVESISNQDILQ
jgi:hypothetical protein